MGQHVAIDECSSHSWVGPFSHCKGAVWDGAVHCHAGWASIRKKRLSLLQPATAGEAHWVELASLVSSLVSYCMHRQARCAFCDMDPTRLEIIMIVNRCMQ